MTDRQANDMQAQRLSKGQEDRSSGIGWRVFLALAVLTVVEFVLAVTIDANLPILVVIALVKAGLIVYYFMHLLRVWRGAT